jgi:hypothetical protein
MADQAHTTPTPDSVSRRSVLKSAASLPFIASGIATVAALSAIADMVSEYWAVEEELLAAQHAGDIIAEAPGAMEWPRFYLAELPDKWHMMSKEAFYTEQGLARHFDQVIAYYEEHLNSADEGMRKYAQVWHRKFSDQKAEALEMYRPRHAAYQRWREASGYGDAIAKVEEICDRREELFAAIVDAPVESITDVRVKADFFARYYQDDEHFEPSIATRVLQSLRAA